MRSLSLSDLRLVCIQKKNFPDPNHNLVRVRHSPQVKGAKLCEGGKRSDLEVGEWIVAEGQGLQVSQPRVHRILS